MVSEHVGNAFSWLRDHVARGLLALHVHPNHVTVAGMLLTIGAGLAVAAGRAYWPLGLGLIVGAGGCDMLDGAMAKLAGLKSRFGAVFDSMCDRISDAALYFGPALYFVRQPDAPDGTPPNLTLAVLAGAGLVWAYMVSYTRARAGDVHVACDGGFWQRGERVVTMMLGVGFGHVTTALWILGLLPVTTVAHRVWCVRRTCHLLDEGRTEEAATVEPRGVPGLVLWRWRRGSLPFDLYAGTIIALCVFLDVPAADPLRDFLGGA